MSVSDETTSLLLEEILEGGLYLRIRVTGRSMVPFLNSSETVTAVRVPPSGLRIGDLIFFRDAHGFTVLHRIVRKRRGPDGNLLLQTMGDALSRCDSPISGDKVLGKVCRIEKSALRARPIDMDSFYQRRVNTLIAAIQLARMAAYRTFSLLIGIAGM